MGEIKNFPFSSENESIQTEAERKPSEYYTTYNYHESPPFQPQPIAEIPDSLLWPTISWKSLKITIKPSGTISERSFDKLCYAAFLSLIIAIVSMMYIVPHWPLLGFHIVGLFGLISLISSLAVTFYDDKRNPNRYNNGYK